MKLFMSNVLHIWIYNFTVQNVFYIGILASLSKFVLLLDTQFHMPNFFGYIMQNENSPSPKNPNILALITPHTACNFCSYHNI